MVNSKSVKALLNWVGFALAIAGMIFVFMRLRVHVSAIDIAVFTNATIGLLVVLSAVYGSANLLLSSAWRDLLSYCGADRSTRWAIRVYGLSQIVKYVPGNIFQFVGRQALGVASGVNGWVLVRSTAWEIGLISVAGALFSIILIDLYLDFFSRTAAGSAFLLLAAALVAFLSRFVDSRVSAAFAKQVLFLAVSGLVFFACLLVVSGGMTVNVTIAPTVVGAFVLGWLAGLLTPGAPAGLGIREAVLILLLEDIGAEPVILMAVVVSRIVNVAGDVLFFGGASMMQRAS